MSSTALLPTITKAGMTALFNATLTGLQAELSHVALGTASWTPDDTATALQAEVSRVPVAGGRLIDWNQIQVTALDDSDVLFECYEVGFYLDSGELFAIWSDPTLHPDTAKPGLLAVKTHGINLVMTFDLILQGIPPDSITLVLPEQDITVDMSDELAKFAIADIDGMKRMIEMARRCCAAC